MPKCGHCEQSLSVAEIRAHYEVYEATGIVPPPGHRGPLPPAAPVPPPVKPRPNAPESGAEVAVPAEQEAQAKERQEQRSQRVAGDRSKVSKRREEERRAQEILREVDARKPKGSKSTGKSKAARVERDPDDTRGRWNKFGESPRPSGKPYKKDY